MSINICFITARILEKPKKLKYNLNYIVKTEINFPHAKNYFANAITLAEGEIANNLFELYIEGDYVIIEGELVVTNKKQKFSGLIIYITDIQPASIITA